LTYVTTDESQFQLREFRLHHIIQVLLVVVSFRYEDDSFAELVMTWTLHVVMKSGRTLIISAVLQIQP